MTDTPAAPTTHRNEPAAQLRAHLDSARQTWLDDALAWAHYDGRQKGLAEARATTTPPLDVSRLAAAHINVFGFSASLAVTHAEELAAEYDRLTDQSRSVDAGGFDLRARLTDQSREDPT